MNNGPGGHAIQFDLQSVDFTTLICGGILRVVAGVMADDQRLQNKQKLTI